MTKTSGKLSGEVNLPKAFLIAISQTDEAINHKRLAYSL
jgi:hypothetical protein